MENTGLKHEIRAILDAQFDEDVRVEFVEDGDRIDVRITDLGVTGALGSRFEDLSITQYSDYRFTVQLD